MKLLYVQRIGQFIAKLILKKHQRALVTIFKKYQVDDLGESIETGNDSSQLLAPTIQEDGTLLYFNEFADSEFLTEN